jgi:exodeoxyribonuclease VII large subunit
VSHETDNKNAISQLEDAGGNTLKVAYLMGKTYLKTTYLEREKVKGLGARWDGAAKKWYVPDELELSVFQHWLSTATNAPEASEKAAPATRRAATSYSRELAIPQDETGELASTNKGISLSQLLGGVRQVIEEAYRQGVWTKVEVIKADVRRGHVYLELTERDPQGQAIATARGMIWAAVANKIMPAFEQATGMVVGPGMKLLARAKPSFSPLYGLSLEIDSIDPSYTLGDLEAKKREIIAQLTREGLLDRNKQLPAPWDYTQVLVIAPEQAAGLGDFQAESERLQSCGVCMFTFVHAVFQGEAAPAQIMQALQRELGNGPGFDAVVIIRGGGAVNDLAWLNDYELARSICDCPVPVFTGIGHERDKTVLDAVAHTSYDTPSKVILGIENQISHIWRTAQANFVQIQKDVTTRCAETRLHVIKDEESVRHQAIRHVGLAKEKSMKHLHDVQRGSGEAISAVRLSSQQTFGHVQARALSTVAKAKEGAPAMYRNILDQATAKVRAARDRAAEQMNRVANNADQIVQQAKDQTGAMMREIVGQGPDKTLRRGFAVVRNAANLKPITSAAELGVGREINIQMHDGAAKATTRG